MSTVLFNKHLLNTSYVPSTILSTEPWGEQAMVPAQAAFILLYHVVYTLLSVQITQLLVKTRDSHPHRIKGPRMSPENLHISQVSLMIWWLTKFGEMLVKWNKRLMSGSTTFSLIRNNNFCNFSAKWRPLNSSPTCTGWRPISIVYLLWSPVLRTEQGIE